MRLAFGQATFLHLVGGVRHALSELIDIGSVVAIDDQLISYFGQDMRNDYLAVQIPDKPHGYGLFSVGAAVKLPRCGLRVLIDIEVQEAAHKITPPTALITILKRLRARVHYPFVSVCDSAFVTKDVLAKLISWDQKFVLSLKQNRAAQYSAILKLGSADIPTDQSRTFSSAELVLQISQRLDHTTSILTNAFSHLAQNRAEPQRTITHRTAWNLFAAFSPAELTALFPDSLEPQTDDLSEIVKRITGFDPLLAPPGKDGKQVITVEYLFELDAESLRKLARRMQATGAINSMKKEDLIKVICRIARLPLTQSEPSSQAVRPEKYVENRTSIARGPTSSSHTVTDYYGEHYGYIDQFNREFFCVIRASGQNSYKTVLVLQLVSSCILNAYAVHTELNTSTPQQPNQSATAHTKSIRHGKCADFVLNLVEEILGEVE